MATKEISPVENNFPLNVFVHTPKCFGTTVITFLAKASRKHIEHIELDKRFKFNQFNPDDFNELDWISGHRNIDIFMDQLKWTSKEVRYFATVRKPIDQVASLVNYFYYQLKNRYSLSTINNIGKELVAIDKKSPESIAQHLLNFPEVYFGVQSKNILGKNYSKALSSPKILNQYISKYSYIATESKLLELFNSFGFDINPEISFQNVNENYEIDKKLFETDIVRSVIESYSWEDFKLYDCVNNFSFKPLVVNKKKIDVLVISTEKNFDEVKYVEANPDIKLQILNGNLKSGHEHFLHFGKHEERKQYQ